MADGVKPGDDPADAPANPADPPAAAGGDATADETTQSIEANFQRIADAAAQLSTNGWSYIGPVYRCSTCGYLHTKGGHTDGNVKGCNRRVGVLTSPENAGLLFADSKAQADQVEQLVYILSNEKRRDEEREAAARRDEASVDELNRKISAIEKEFAICSGIKDEMIRHAQESRSVAEGCFTLFDEIIGARDEVAGGANIDILLGVVDSLKTTVRPSLPREIVGPIADPKAATSGDAASYFNKRSDPSKAAKWGVIPPSVPHVPVHGVIGGGAAKTPGGAGGSPAAVSPVHPASSSSASSTAASNRPGLYDRDPSVVLEFPTGGPLCGGCPVSSELVKAPKLLNVKFDEKDTAVTFLDKKRSFMNQFKYNMPNLELPSYLSVFHRVSSSKMRLQIDTMSRVEGYYKSFDHFLKEFERKFFPDLAAVAIAKWHNLKQDQKPVMEFYLEFHDVCELLGYDEENFQWDFLEKLTDQSIANRVMDSNYGEGLKLVEIVSRVAVMEGNANVRMARKGKLPASSPSTGRGAGRGAVNAVGRGAVDASASPAGRGRGRGRGRASGNQQEQVVGSVNQTAEAPFQQAVGRRRRKKIRAAGLDVNAVDVSSLQFDRQGNVVMEDPGVAGVSDWALDVEFHEQQGTGRGRSRSRGRGRGRGRAIVGNGASVARPGAQQFVGGAQQPQQRSQSAAPANGLTYNQNNNIRRYDREMTKDFEEWRQLQQQLNIVGTCFGCLEAGHGFRRDFAHCKTGRCPLCLVEFTARGGHAAMDCASLPARGEDIIPTMRGERERPNPQQLQIQQ